MLPIVRKKALQIPHGLAALAAGICLVLAFSTDFNERRQQLLAEQQETAVSVLAAARDETQRNDAAVKTEPRTREAGATRPPMQLLPWFPGLRQGGG